MAKVVVLLSPTRRTRLLQIPDTFSEREITRYYSVSAEDLAVIEQHRRPQNRLGFTVQLAYLRFPGRPWDPQEQVPPAILTYLAEQIGEAPDVLADYASRDPTRREHLSEIQRVFHFHPFTIQTYRDLSRWLMPIALSTDQGMVLMEALIEELRARHVLLPAVSRWNGWDGRPVAGPNSKCLLPSPRVFLRSNESNSMRSLSYRQMVGGRGFHGCVNHQGHPSPPVSSK